MTHSEALGEISKGEHPPGNSKAGKRLTYAHIKLESVTLPGSEADNRTRRTGPIIAIHVSHFEEFTLIPY